MGKGRDKRKKNRGAPAAGHGSAKTERKTHANDAKRQRRQAPRGEDDIDAILAQLDTKKTCEACVHDGVTPPGPRVCGIWLPCNEQNGGALLLFGGEHWDRKSDRVTMFSDLYLYHPSKDSWSYVECPAGPGPRSACAGAVHKGCLYIFGGEYTSPNQKKFKHFRDLWRLDMSTWTWDELPGKAGPSARSGHRMLCHKGHLYLFGGYYDTGDALPKYYADMWRYDVGELRWEALGDARAKWPSPRSGFQWVLHGDQILMHGGYSKQRDDGDESMEHGVALEDTWMWDIASAKWQQKPKAGMAPCKRASFSMAGWKSSAYLFGGAADDEVKGGEVLVSTFFNDLYQYNISRERWYPVTMRAMQAPQTDAMAALTEQIGHLSANEGTAKQRAATRIQAHYRGHVVRKAYKLYRIGGVVSEVLYSPAAYGIDLSSARAPKPRGRINASLAVLHSALYLWGGIVEIGDVEVTLDDLWRVDLSKLAGWQLLKDNTAGGSDFEDESGASASEDSI